MAGEWPRRTLQELQDKAGKAIAIGPFGSKMKADCYRPSGVPILRGNNITDTRRLRDEFVFISEEKANELAAANVFPDDLYFPHRGSIGEVGIVPHDEYPRYVLSTAMMKITVDKTLVDPMYVYYFFRSDEGRREMLLNESTVGTPGIGQPLASLRRFTVPTPPLPEQRAIARILGTLDDKIELNRRMNETLEAMARALFKSWFEDFDPVRARSEGRNSGLPESIVNMFPDSFESTELGDIPKGWMVTPLKHVCDRITDGSHFSPKSVKAGWPMASVKDMRDWTFDLNSCRRISDRDYQDLVRNDCRPLAQDIVIAKDGSYLKHIFVIENDLDLVILSSIAIIRPSDCMDEHLLAFTLRSDTTMARMERYVSGAVLQRIVLKDFRQFLILVPPKDIQLAWARIAHPLVQRCWRNVSEIEGLTAQRDLLLPMLMSGELRIRDAERLVARSAA